MGTIITTTDVTEFRESIMKKNDDNFKETDFAVFTLEFDFGMKKDNSIDKYRFYTKKNPDKSYQVYKENISILLPTMFYEQKLVIFCLTEDEIIISAIEKAISSVCAEKISKRLWGCRPFVLGQVWNWKNVSMKKSLDAKLSLIPQGSKSQKTGKKNDETEPDFEKRFRAKLYSL